MCGTVVLCVLRDARFRRFWAAQAISEAGSGVGALALPLTAVVTLGASAMDMGVLAAAATLPALLFSLHIGVWVDRLPRRPILIATSVGRGVLLAFVPLLAVTGWLRIELLVTIAFAVGTLAVVFDIAVTSFVPSFVERARLVDANAALQASSAAARVAGPGAGGWLIELVGPPFTLMADAVSLLISAGLLAGLRVQEHGGRARQRGGVVHEIVEGINAIWDDRVLRAMVVSTTVAALGGSVQQAVYVLFVYRDVDISPALLGIILAAGGLAGLAGAALAGRTARLLGEGGAMLAGQIAITVSMVVLLGARPGVFGIVLVSLAQVLFAAGLRTFSVTQISLRQAVTPGHLLGRVNATRRVAAFGIQPAGALLGGALGATYGLHVALAAAAAINIIALASILASPLRYAREATL